MIREARDTHCEADQVSFADLVQAKFEAQRADGAAADLDATRQAFIKHFGPIIRSRFGKNTVCGVALTDLNAAAGRDPAPPSQPASAGDRRSWLRWLRTPHWERRWLRRERRSWLTEQRKPVSLHLVFPTLELTTAQVVMSLSRCEKQAVYARRFLEGEELRQCLTLLYWPADALIEFADADAAPASVEPAAANMPSSPQLARAAPTPETAKNDPSTNGLADVVNQQLDFADQYYQYFTQRTIRLAYFRGIGYGMVAVVGLFTVFYAFRGFFHAPIPLLWSIMAGALGALTSVLSSATFGRIVLDRPQGGIWNTFLGAFRPVIGALFGAAFFTLINAGFLPIKIPGGDGKLALYASIAFLAGFSHRWAQDTLKAAEARVPAPPSPPEGGVEQGATVKPAQQKV